MTEGKIGKLNRLFLWIGSGCNARCKMCDIWREKPGRQMSVADVHRWIPEWQHMSIRTVIVCGEALMNTDVWPIAKAIRDAGMYVKLLTNGLLLERHAVAAAEHCDAIRVSLDGPREIHDATRGVSNAYDRLAKGLRALRRERSDLNVEGRCAVHNGNFRNLRATVAAAHDLNLSSISFSGTDLSNEEAFRRLNGIDEQYVSSLIVHEGQLPELEEELTLLRRDCAADFASGFIRHTPEDLDRRLLQYYRGLTGVAPMPPVACNAPLTSAVLEHDGTVRPCFPMPAYGNIRHHDTLAATINSPQAVTFRHALDVLTNDICRRCVTQKVSVA